MTWERLSRGGVCKGMDDNNKRSAAQRNQEPGAIDTDPTAVRPAGNTLTPTLSPGAQAANLQQDGLLWIEQEDQAKQGMARKPDMRNARAAENHPHLGHTRGSGESQ